MHLLWPILSTSACSTANIPGAVDDHSSSAKPWYSHQPLHLSGQTSHSSLATPKPFNLPLHLLPTRSSLTANRPTSNYFSQVSYRGLLTGRPLVRRVLTQNSHRHVKSIKNDQGAATKEIGTSSLRKSPLGHKSPERWLPYRRVLIDADAAEHLSHLNSSGEAHMIDISHKRETLRTATAHARLLFSKITTYESLMSANAKKGDALAVARIAAIQAAKKTSDLIPLAHPGLGLTGIEVVLTPFEHESSVLLSSDRGGATYIPTSSAGGVDISATVSCYGKTGVEMEAMTSASVGALTLYDMLKGVDKAMTIDQCRVVSKSGGKSGDWKLDTASKQVMYANNYTRQGQIEGASDQQLPQWNGVTIHHRYRTNRMADVDTEMMQLLGPENRWRIGYNGQVKRVALLHHNLRYRKRELTLEMEKVRLEREKINHERDRLRLCALEIEKEIDNRVAKMSQNKSTNHDQTRVQNQNDHHSQNQYAQEQEYHRTQSEMPDSQRATPSSPFSPSSSSSPSVEGIMTSDRPPSSLSSQSPSPSPSADPNFTPALSALTSSSSFSTTESSHSEEDSEPFKFDRSARDLMSGTWSSRADKQAFETRRIQRYEDWARGR